MNKQNKKVTAYIMTLSLAITTLFSGSVAYAEETTESAILPKVVLSDISGHWGEDYIKDAVAEGFVQGYEDGTLKPNNYVTRAEFVTMVNKALQLRNENTVNLVFSDVQDTKWYYKDIQKASYARVHKWNQRFAVYAGQEYFKRRSGGYAGKISSKSRR